MSYDEKVLRSEYAFSGLEVLLCDMFRRSRAWVWPELLRFSRGRSVVVAGHLNLYRGRVDQRDLLPQRVSSRECGSAMAACVTRLLSFERSTNLLMIWTPDEVLSTHPLSSRRTRVQSSGSCVQNLSTRDAVYERRRPLYVVLGTWAHVRGPCLIGRARVSPCAPSSLTPKQIPWGVCQVWCLCLNVPPRL